MPSNRRSGRSSRSGQSGFTAGLERMTQRLDRITTMLETIAARIGSNMAAQSPNSEAPLSSPPMDLGEDFNARPHDFSSSLPDTSPSAQFEATGEQANEAAWTGQHGLPMADDSFPASGPLTGISQLMPAIGELPSTGMASLQDYARDTNAQGGQLEQIRIAREQLAEHKKTNQYLERQHGDKPAAFGP